MVIVSTAEATHGENALEARNTSSRKMLLAGRIVSGLLVLFFDSIVKVLKLDAAVEGSAKLGYPESTVIGIGLALLVATVLYVVPRTAFVGAILLSGYLGGAIATQVRVEDASFVFPVILGVLVWVGLYLRDDRLRTFLIMKADNIDR